MFVTGFSSSVIDMGQVSKSGSYTPKPAAQAAARPAAAFNVQPIPTPQGKPTMTRPTDAALLRELASKTLNDSAFAINTNDLQGAAKRLRDTLGYVERLIQANGTPGIQGNAGHAGGGFAGYSMNALNAG